MLQLQLDIMTRIVLTILLLSQSVALGILYSSSRKANAVSVRYESQLTALQDRLDHSTLEFQSAVAEMRIHMATVDGVLKQYEVQLTEAMQKAIDVQRDSAIAAVAGSVHSRPSGMEITVTFINGDKDRAYDIYWIDFNGKPVRYQSLVPGAEYDQSTYVGHPWAFVDSRGTVLKRLYVPTAAEHQTVVLRGTEFELSIQKTAPRAQSVIPPADSGNGF